MAASAPISPEHLQTLFEIVQTINSSLDFDEVLRLVMDSMMVITRAQRGFLMVVAKDGQLEIRVARGMDAKRIEDETPYSTTIVREVVATREALLTNNAMFDRRYAQASSIVLRGVRAILCAPMIVRDRLIGVVYVDTSMRQGTFTESDLHLLKVVAGQAGIAIENARLYGEAVEKGRLERELQMAREIQQSLLPNTLPELPEYSIAARWQPAYEVSGDFYDAFLHTESASTDHHMLDIVIADVSDKGAPAALFMASTRSLFRSYARLGFPPDQILALTNDRLIEDAHSGMFVTAAYLRLWPDGNGIYAGAGHLPPILWRAAQKKVEILPLGTRALGWFPQLAVSAVPFRLEIGDIVLAYTDGLTESENSAGESFGTQRLIEALSAEAHQSVERLVDGILQSAAAFSKDTPVSDDRTLILARREH